MQQTSQETSARRSETPSSKGKGLWWILAAIILVVLWFGMHINRAPQLAETADAAWSQVLNQYQRRSDLVPNLVETVKGYATHERALLKEVTEARARVGQINLPANVTQDPQALENFQKAQQELGGALTKLLAVAESYPNLKANENFKTLQAQLEGTENRIAVERRNYIDTVRALNTELKTIPGRWVASLFYPDIQPRANFTAEAAAMKNPEVKF